MKKIFINGYGSIGKRLTKFIQDDPTVEIIGIGKHSPTENINKIKASGLSIYVPHTKLSKFQHYQIDGTIEDVLDDCDLVIDASPSGYGFKNKKNIYDKKNLLVIYQGGETIFGDNAVSNLLFNSKINYSDAHNKQHVVQGSCNVTGIGRILNPFKINYANDIIRFDITLIRRWADLDDNEIIDDSIELTYKPHHILDIKSYMGTEIPLFLRAIKVPTRQMHLHLLDIRFKNNIPSKNDIISLFKNEYGVAILNTAKGTKEIREFAKSMKFSFIDTNMIHIYAKFIEIVGDTIKICYSDDQTGIVIPENHLLMQAMLFKKNYNDALQHTENMFHINEKKKLLEDHFK